MRDGAIVEMQQANAKRSALLLGQFEFLQTRQEAMERVIKVSSIVDRVKWLFWPKNFFAVVDAVQMKLMHDRQAKLEEVSKRPKIDIVKSL